MQIYKLNKKSQAKLIKGMTISIFLISISSLIFVLAGEQALPQETKLSKLGALTIEQTDKLMLSKTETDIYEYQNQKILNYNLDWASVNIALLKDIGEIKSEKNYSLAVNDIFVTQRENSYKFGANDNLNSKIESYKYVIESSSPIIENELRPYIYKTIQQEFYEVEERHEFWFYDICDKAFNCLGEEENYTCEYYADCKFDYSTKEEDGKTIYVLEISFNSNNSIDPTITIEDVATSVSQRNDTISENKFIHLNISNSAPYNSLLIYMPFDTNTSTTTVYDYSENNNDGTIQGNARYINSGKYGGAMEFDGNGDGITMGNVLNFGTIDFTVSYWINYNNSARIERPIMKRSGCSANTFWEVLHWTDGDIGFYTYSDINGDCSVSTTKTYTIGAWHNVVAVRNSTNILIYVDGIMNATSSCFPARDVTNTANFLIGDSTCTNADLTGPIDEVMLFNTSLTSTQIQSIYNNQSARFKASGKAIFNKQLDFFTDEVNVTSDLQNLFGTNLSLTIYYKNLTGWFYTDSKNISDEIWYNFTVVDASEINLSYEFLADSAKFYTPILQNNIIVKYGGTYPSFGGLHTIHTILSDGAMTPSSRVNNMTKRFDWGGTNDHDTQLNQTEWTSTINEANGNNSDGNFTYFFGTEWTGNSTALQPHIYYIALNPSATQKDALDLDFNNVAKLAAWMQQNSSIGQYAHPARTTSGTDFSNSSKYNETWIPLVEIKNQNDWHWSYYWNCSAGSGCTTYTNPHIPSGQTANSTGWIKYALDKYIHLGFSCAGDFHGSSDYIPNCYVGLTNVSIGNRSGVYEALKARHTWVAENKTWMNVTVNNGSEIYTMGDIFSYASSTPNITINYTIISAQQFIRNVSLFYNGVIVNVTKFTGLGATSVVGSFIQSLTANQEDYLFIEAIQDNGARAWSSPMWINYTFTTCAPPISGNWNWNFADNCNLANKTYNINSYNITSYNSGTWTLNNVTITCSNFDMNSSGNWTIIGYPQIKIIGP